jgi:DMSO/TMAO reductase YedYZ molybdopterin-dependent catalytic subunit
MRVRMLDRVALGVALLLVLAAGGCGGAEDPAATTTAPATTTAEPAVTTTVADGALAPIVVPTLPAEIPGYTELDPLTGLHMTGTPVVIDIETYRLVVRGNVDTPLSLSYDDLRRLPKISATPDLVCPGFFVDTATWSGASLATVLAMAGPRPGAAWVDMIAADDYSHLLKLETALGADNLLAYEWMGEPLPVLHGFPVRAVLPAESGAAWVKWLLEIVVE